MTIDDEKQEEWLDTKEAAAYLKISEASLRNMTSNGQVPYYKLQRRNRYMKRELREMLLGEKRGPGALDNIPLVSMRIQRNQHRPWKTR